MTLFIVMTQLMVRRESFGYFTRRLIDLLLKNETKAAARA